MNDLGLKTVKIFADGANLQALLDLAEQPHISGFTTNPTLMRQSGVSDYEGFARKLLEHITDRPISFEVFADEHDEMLRQARLIASWASKSSIIRTSSSRRWSVDNQPRSCARFSIRARTAG